MKNILILTLITLLTLSSCGAYTTTGALFGSTIGSAIGGIAGGPRGRDIGTIVGAIAGASAGAAAEENARDRQARRMEAAKAAARREAAMQNAADDDVYIVNDAKAERVRRYHENTEAKYSGRYTGRSMTGSGNYGRPTGIHVGSNGVRVDTTSKTDSLRMNSETQNNGGYNQAGNLDDRIEMK